MRSRTANEVLLRFEHIETGRAPALVSVAPGCGFLLEDRILPSHTAERLLPNG